MTKREKAARLRDAGLSNSEIAKILGVPVASARRLVSEGRAAREPHEFVLEPPPPSFAREAMVLVNEQAESPAVLSMRRSFEKHQRDMGRDANAPLTILVIPDTQCKPDVSLDHLYWAGRYIAEKQPDVVIHLGDHWDMPSLSSYEGKGSRYFEGKRVTADIAAGNRGLELLEQGMGGFKPKRKVLLRGNHEDRITRAVNEDPRLEGLVGFHQFNDVELGWEVVDFLKVITIGGVAYSHYFYQPNSGRPYSGSVENMLKNIGYSFCQGHQQGLRYARRELGNGTAQVGLVAGSFYQHCEAYRGPQAANEWRGLVVKHEVREGDYDPLFISLNYLKKKFG